MRELWRRLSKLVERPRSGGQQLSVALEDLPAYYDPVTGDRHIIIGPPNDVLRLLYRDTERAPSGLGPHRIESFGPVGDTYTRPLPGDSTACGDCTTQYRRS